MTAAIATAMCCTHRSRLTDSDGLLICRSPQHADLAGAGLSLCPGECSEAGNRSYLVSLQLTEVTNGHCVVCRLRRHSPAFARSSLGE